MNKRILALSLLFLSNSLLPIGGYPTVEQYQTTQQGQSKSTIAAALALAAYAGHRTYQYFAHKAIYNAPKKHLKEKISKPNSPVIVQALHGMGGYGKNMKKYLTLNSNLPLHIEAIDFPSSALIGQPGHLAQQGNIDCVINKYQQLSDLGRNVILYGVSDGAASAITTLGSYTLKNVKAAILESPYADIKQAVRRVLRRLYCHWIPGIGTLGSLLVSMIHSGYSTYGIRPIDVVHKIQKNVPVLFVCVKNDIITPEEGTIALYNALKAAGHIKVHLLVLDAGDHGFLLSGLDGHKYRTTLHAFLRKYGLPHDPALAAQCKHKDFNPIKNAKKSTH